MYICIHVYLCLSSSVPVFDVKFIKGYANYGIIDISIMY